MAPEIKVEAMENSPFSKISLSSYDHIPFQSEYNTIPVYKNLDFFTTKTLEAVLDFEVFEDDVWVVTFPKCGTTWTQEMVWLLMNNMDFKQAKNMDIELRSQFVESSLEAVEQAKVLPRPRVLKSHETMPLLPKELWTKNPKILFVVRDPRDAFVSLHHYHRYLFGKTSTTDKEGIIESRLKYGQFWEKVLNFYAIKDKNNVMFLSFEQMKKNLKSVVLRVSEFLGKHYNENLIDQLVEHLDFKNMKNNPAVSHRHEVEEFRKRKNIKEEEIIKEEKFIRKGMVGSHKEELSDEILKKIDAWQKGYLEKENLTLDDILWST